MSKLKEFKISMNYTDIVVAEDKDEAVDIFIKSIYDDNNTPNNFLIDLIKVTVIKKGK